MKNTYNDIALLEEAVKTEESAIQIYTRHIESTLFLSGFKEETGDRIKQTLQVLAEESQKHKGWLETRIAELKGM